MEDSRPLAVCPGGHGVVLWVAVRTSSFVGWAYRCRESAPRGGVAPKKSSRVDRREFDRISLQLLEMWDGT